VDRNYDMRAPSAARRLPTVGTFSTPGTQIWCPSSCQLDVPWGIAPRKGRNVVRKRITTVVLAVENQSFLVRYFTLHTVRGRLRYSAEILLGPGDWIILDDDSVPNLKARAVQLIPATLYSRMLAHTA
jgi:hypothetical protein